MNNQNYDDNRYDFSVHEKYHNSTSVEKNIVDKNDSNGHNLSDFNISVDTTKSDNFVEKPSSDGESTYESINDRSNANETFTISFDALSGESIELTNGNISFSYEDLSLNHIGNVIDCSEGISHMEQQLLAKERNTATTNDPETESTLFLCEDLNPIQNLTFIASSEDISNLHPVPAPEGSIPQAATTNDSSTFSGSQLTVFVESPSHGKFVKAFCLSTYFVLVEMFLFRFFVICRYLYHLVTTLALNFTSNTSGIMHMKHNINN